jgi:hypothetical protein
MPTPQPTDRAAIGRARLAERARRVARIRRTVIAATLSAFVLAWGVIVFDGSMGSTTFANSSSTTASPSATATPDTSSSDDLSSSSSDSSPAPLTTSQS